MALKTVIKDCLPAALQGQTASQLNQAFLTQHKNDLGAQLIGARMMVTISEAEADKAVKAVTQLDSSLTNRNLDTCHEVLTSLADGDFTKVGLSAAQAYKQSCRKLFPLAKCFQDQQAVSSKGVKSSVVES